MTQPSGMTRGVALRRGCCIVALLFIVEASLAAAPPGKAPSPPLPDVTVDRLMAEGRHELSNLQWLDDQHLAGNLVAGSDAGQYVWSLDGGPSTLLARGREGRMSPDGTRVAAREKDDWVVREATGARRELARLPGAYGDNPAGMLAWSRDSNQVALVQESRAAPLPPDTVTVENGVRYVDVGAEAQARDAAGRAASTITVLDLGAPATPRRFPFAGQIQALEWGASDDLYFVAQRFWNTGNEAPATIVRALRQGVVREVFRVGGVMQSIGPRISPDGRWLSLTADLDSPVWDDFPSLVIVDLASGVSRRLTSDRFVIGSSVRWATDSSGLYFASRDGGWTQFHRAGLDGGIARLTDSPSEKRELQISPDGRRLGYVSQDGLGTLDLRVVDIDSRRDRRIAMLNQPADRYRLGRFERVKFPTHDGLAIAGWVVYPPDFDPARKYPLYVDVHGGGPGSYLYLFAPISIMVVGGPLEWHAWAARGYVVFVPDYRSSGEYGPGVASARHLNGDYGGIEADVRDIEAGVQWMTAKPFVDATRVGIFGASAGGGRVNLLLTRSSRYRAGALGDAIAAGVLPDFIATVTGPNAGSTGSQKFWETRVGKFADKRGNYLGGFLFDGYKSTTPTLILVGDQRLGALNPLSSEVLFSMLRQHDIPTRMLRYPDDGHGFRTAASARHAFEQVARWLSANMDMSTDADGRILFDRDRVRPLTPSRELR